ncbi:kynureninase [Altibacter sp. HG106]|uniref:kynureninase n=1 Tax=Altibacter sp. HG106 TaxID=3023937 RepID=UPI002350B727|nr:kynureninase [Altibacter sp. HG106]MDC7995866.1 kynureninase [Altibacter sp. HG106]
MENSLSYAQEQDTLDPLRSYRERFLFPKNEQGDPLLYFCGNSLGLQPKSTREYVSKELEDWAKYGVEGHTDARHPWMPYHEFLTEQMAQIVGAKPEEVIIMNTLSVNLHLMMVSFYRPTSQCYKIIIERDAFPSDKYAVESQLQFHGHSPEDGLILWEPPEGEELCRFEDLEELMKTHADEVALLLIGSTNYYSGQAFPLKKITSLGHAQGAMVGFDLAHGAGNIQPDLHEVGADFAIWCTYKYLNSGPGSLGGCFIHERHLARTDLPRFTGWWGHDKSTRFNMRHDFKPIPTAEGWQLSNPPILSMAAIRASLDIFAEAGMEALRKKSVQLTGYLEFLLNSLNNQHVTIITPRQPEARGCQLSIQVQDANRSLHEQLTDAGVISDWREPDVIRVAPTPLYNSFVDVFQFVDRLKKVLHER